jgi:hypothetical protein
MKTAVLLVLWRWRGRRELLRRRRRRRLGTGALAAEEVAPQRHYDQQEDRRDGYHKLEHGRACLSRPPFLVVPCNRRTESDVRKAKGPHAPRDGRDDKHRNLDADRYCNLQTV